jgi:hypothetical protein
MSLILDALNRSRQDTSDVPGLATQHFEPVEPAGGDRWRVALPWLALVVAAGVIVWLALERGREPVASAPPVAEAVVPATTLQSADTLQQGPVPASGGRSVEAVRAPDPRPADTAQPVVVPVPDRTEQSAAAGGRSPAEQHREVTEPAGQELAADPEVAALYQREAPAASSPLKPAVSATAADTEAPPETPPTQRDEQPVDLEHLVVKAQREVDNARLSEHPAPFVIDLSQQKKDAVPTIFYQRHDYAGDSASSSVVLNGKTLRVGGLAAPGVKVEEILPDSVVLSHDGNPFRLRALNSWVNL